MTSSLLSIVRRYSAAIRNGRTQRTINAHMVSEVEEHEFEVALVDRGLPEGKDGIVGEAIDIIACALDSIFEHDPDISDEELDVLMESKCAKWAAKYQNRPATSAARNAPMVEFGRHAQVQGLLDQGWAQDEECNRLGWGEDRIGGPSYLRSPEGLYYAVSGGTQRLLQGTYRRWMGRLPESMQEYRDMLMQPEMIKVTIFSDGCVTGHQG